SVQSAREIRENGRAFIVGMGCYVENAGGYAGAVDGFNRFGETRTGARGWRKLRVSGSASEQDRRCKDHCCRPANLHSSPFKSLDNEHRTRLRGETYDEM